MIEHINDILAYLKEEMAQKTRVILAIDGTSAALKSTLAECLARELDGAVIHCDDFFLPIELRSQERYEEPGGNIHYERMKEEVIQHLRQGEGFNYVCYDCGSGMPGDTRHIPDKPLLIVEGAYAMHPFFGAYYDLSLFLTVEPQMQMQRIEKRNPNPQMFRDKWIPLEQKYFEAFDIRSRADMILDTTNWK